MYKGDQENNIIQLHTYEFLQLHALCDELITNLCQAKALLRHYFYALDTIIDGALSAKDEICQVVDGQEKTST